MAWTNPFDEGPPVKVQADTGWKNPFDTAEVAPQQAGWKNPFDEEEHPGPFESLKRYTKGFGKGIVQMAALPFQVFDATAGPDQPVAPSGGQPGQPSVTDLLNPIPPLREFARNPTPEGAGQLAGSFAGGRLVGA